jgi:hypothetical protein
LYKNFIVSLYSFIESQLFELCDLLKTENKLSLRHKDLSDRGVYQAKKYLLKVAKVDLQEKLWEELDMINTIRNTIVHNDGGISDADKRKTMKYLSKYELVNSKDDNGLNLSVGFCFHLINFTRTFFTNLYYDSGLTGSSHEFISKK